MSYPSILWGADANSNAIITNTAGIRRLSREESALAYPVKLQATVTYSDSQWGLLFLHDTFGGIFARLRGISYPSNYEHIEISGHVGEGGFLPIIVAESWRTLGTAELPETRRIHRPDLYASQIDCEWSELIGIVQRINIISGQPHVQLDVMDRGWRARVFLCEPTGGTMTNWDQLIDAKVSIIGVGGVDNDSIRGITGLKMFVPSSNCIRLLDKPQPNPFSLPHLPLAQVRSMAWTNLPIHRVHVQGAITYQKHPGKIIIQDETDAMEIQCNVDNSYKAGDIVEAVGFVVPSLFSPVLEDAIVRKSTVKCQARPMQVTPGKILWGDCNARLVEITGTLKNHTHTKSNLVLTLLENGILFGVVLESLTSTNDWEQFQLDDRLRVIGVCALQGDRTGAPQSFHVLIRSVKDVVRLSHLRVFSLMQVVTILVFAAAAWGLVLLWGVALRRKVGTQTALIRARLEKEAALEQRYHIMIENAAFPVIIFHYDVLTILYVNQRAAMRLYGSYSVQHYALISDCFDGSDSFERMRSELRRLGQLTEFEICFKAADGEQFWTLVCANSVEYNQQPAVFLSFSDITDRKQAEQAKQYSYSLLSAALESTADGLLVVNSAGKVTIMNQIFLDMWHIPESLAASHDDARILQFVLDQLQNPAAFLAKVQELYHNPNVSSWDTLAFGDGRIFERYSQPQRLGDIIVGRVWSFRDVTARHQAEQAQLEEKERFRKMIQNSSDIAILLDRKGTAIYVSDSVKRITGFRSEECVGKSSFDFHHPKDLPVTCRIFEQLLEHPGEVRSVEYRHLTKSGGWVILEAVGTSWLDDPIIKGVVFNARDVTERKRIETEREDLAAQRKLAFNAAQLGWWHYDTASKTITWDDRFKEIYVLSGHRYPDEDLFTRVHPEDIESLLAATGAALKPDDPKALFLEHRLKLPDNSVRWVEVHAVADFDRDGASKHAVRLIGTVADITARKAVEAQLRASLEEKTALIKEVHHRVKNNLQIVTSLLNSQLRQTQNPTTVESLRDVQGRIRSMSIVHEMLYRQGNVTRINCAAYLGELCANLKRSLNPTYGRIQINIQIASIEMDLDHAIPCGLIVNELVTNSFKHGFPEDRRGEIRVNLRSEPRGQLVLSVADNGIGLRNGLKLAATNTLGMQLVIGLAEQIHATITTETNHGTSFELKFSP